jgi:serine/threonine protein kinase
VKLGYREDLDIFCAVKVIMKETMAAEAYQGLFERELRVFQQLRHPRVVQLYDLFQDDLNYYIVMEYCPNGELFGHIISSTKIPEDAARLFFKDVMDALGLVHAVGVAHRDIKPENIFIDADGRLKLGDFGLAKYVGESGITGTGCGSPCYTSPEIISGKPYNAKKSDMWSCGVLLFVMVTGQLPWTQRNQVQLFRQIRRGAYSVPDGVGPDCANLIRSLMTVKQDARLDVDGVLAHPWMADVVNQPIAFYETPTVSLRRLDAFLEWDTVEEPLRLPPRTLSFKRGRFQRELRMIAENQKAVQSIQIKAQRTEFFNRGMSTADFGAQKPQLIPPMKIGARIVQPQVAKKIAPK